MNRMLVSVMAAGLMAPALLVAAQATAAKPKTTLNPADKPAVAASGLATPEAKLGYAMGQDIGRRLKDMGAPIDIKVFAKGVEDALKGNPPQQSEEESSKTMETFFGKLKAEQARKAQEAGDKNLKEGESFFKENGAKKGVVTTQSGLQYTVLQEGTGPSPKSTDTVTVNYRGTLLDGTEFDSSYKRGQPVTFEVSHIIPGWIEGLQLMKAGGKYRLFVPAKLAYGERGAGQAIGPNAALIFDVELISIAPQAK